MAMPCLWCRGSLGMVVVGCNMICDYCGEEFEYENELFECATNICPHCYQEEIRERYGYEGDLIY